MKRINDFYFNPWDGMNKLKSLVFDDLFMETWLKLAFKVTMMGTVGPIDSDYFGIYENEKN